MYEKHKKRDQSNLVGSIVLILGMMKLHFGANGLVARIFDSVSLRMRGDFTKLINFSFALDQLSTSLICTDYVW